MYSLFKTSYIYRKSPARVPIVIYYILFYNYVFVLKKRMSDIVFVEKNPWVLGWNLNPEDTTKNRTDSTVWVVLRDLNENTVYWFRMKVQNNVGYSVPSDSSPSVSTGTFQ